MACSGMRLSFENNSIGLVRIPIYKDRKTTNLEGLVNVTISQVITGLQSFERFGLLMSCSLCSNYELAITSSILMLSSFLLHSSNACEYFPGGSDGKESACNAGDLGSIPGSGRSPGEGNGYPLQYSHMEKSMHRRVWQATVHEVAKSRIQLSD